MSVEAIEAVLDCQSDLITAIDASDVDAIVRASEALAAAVTRLRNVESWPADALAAKRLRSALQQNQAAAIRINLLAHWTRQNIDRVADLRCIRSTGGTHKSM
ncbi:MAG: hypothetical protein IPG54_08070 [Sphingomonadales bacterium]|mgnify:CR=1 FL=1|jgi:hypothetical protein|nr:hypothetical protein [Sphingomonadales bacterium]MBK9004791.1 hypothetical protein [Sphingomonadales bacterium]MBK9267482.1 hypothetical protein [Sphingomonadales bacterium]MBP6433233.1 hypothetical protein [Sphingorhabdus sp.]